MSDKQWKTQKLDGFDKDYEVGQDDLEHIETLDDDHMTPEKAIAPLLKDNLWDKVKKTWRGQTRVGQYLGLGLDIGESFLPQWVGRIRNMVQQKTQIKQPQSNMSLIWKKLKEPSTWIGIIGLLGSVFSFSLSATLEQQVASALAAIVAVVATATKDGKRRKD